MHESSPPAWRSVPDYDGTHGDLAAETGEALGLVPDADQRDILDAIFAYRSTAPSVPVCFECAVVGPRQNIKTSTLVVAAATDLFVFRQPLHIWTAHLFRTSRATFLDLVQRIDAEPELRRLCKKPRMANNQEAVALRTGEEIQFYSRSQGGGRGIPAPRTTFDEALFMAEGEVGALAPMLATFVDAQIRYGSSGGLKSSAVLRGVRDRGRNKIDPALGYFEWAARRLPCEMPECSHAVGTDGCALDNRELWWEANVALGRRITEERIEQFRRLMPPAEFAREFLTWWDDPPRLSTKIDEESWSECRDRESTFGKVAAWAVAVAADLSWSSIAACGVRADGRLHVEIPADSYRRGTAWIAERMVELRRRHGADAPVVVEAKGPRSSVAEDLGAAKVPTVEATPDNLVDACGLLQDTVNRRQLRHLGQPVLEVSLSNAAVRQAGDAWAWSRSASPAEISPLVAATLAVWGAGQGPTAPPETGVTDLNDFLDDGWDADD